MKKSLLEGVPCSAGLVVGVSLLVIGGCDTRPLVVEPDAGGGVWNELPLRTLVDAAIPVDVPPPCVPEDDAPDTSFADTNCDGIDGDASRSVFVSPFGRDGGHDGHGGDGSMQAPLRTLSAALELAERTGRASVLVAAGVYEEQVTLVAEVSIYGGYSPRDWSRDPANIVEVVASSPVMSCVELDSAIEVTDLTVRALDASSYGGSTLALRLSRCFAARFSRVTAVAGKGADGAAGASARDGADGLDGAPGDLGWVHAHVRTDGATVCDYGMPDWRRLPADAVTGLGGAAVCGGCGAGGNGGTPYTGFDASGGVGSPGTGVTGSACAAVSHGGTSVADHQPGVRGDGGTDGSDGAPGQGGSWGVFTVDGYVPREGGSGVDGISGTGGGGGSSGGRLCGLWDLCAVSGGGGGGGGSAGCGGEPGHGGGGGGASVAIAVFDSAVSFDSCAAIMNAAGNGGAGSEGGQGGNGGAGATGGSTLALSSTHHEILMDECLEEPTQPVGGAGGDGGDGGDGGAGGGGAGGLSVGVLYDEVSAQANQDLQRLVIDNTLARAGLAGHAGRGASPGRQGAVKPILGLSPGWDAP